MYVLCGSCYEQGSTGSMAEEGSASELEGLDGQLQALTRRYSGEELRADSQAFCSDFCKLVEEYASHWQVPLPQLRILEISLVYFTRASTFFKSNCDHVHHTLSSLALSVFELLLFFDQKDFHQETLKHFIATFQECHLAVERHQNVHLLQVARVLQGGGPWVSLVLQGILSESILPQNEVDGFIGSELPVFFELRVRYLLSSSRVSEAMALAKCCARHPTTGQHIFFLQFYLTWLHKTSHHDRLHEEVSDVNGKNAVNIICSLEYEEEDELLLALCRSFLSHQLRMGDMNYLCDLVFIWSKLHTKLNTSKQTLLEESHQLMLSATNVNSIFPFIRAILQALGEDGIQFCVELCASALESCLSCDVGTKSFIYKTIAGLLPNDLEVCRACALLVFFLERTFEAYKTVYLLYMHPDQEYHAEFSPIGNHVRFETLQVLKKDLYFDPEFWNLIALRTNCLKLMNEKVVSAALEEIMEDKWISNYCTKEPALRSSTLACHKGNKQAAKKRHHKEDADTASKKLKVSPGKKEKGKKASRTLKDPSSRPLRRSFWQLERLQDNGAIAYGEHRRTTRLSEKNPPKRRIRQPRWLLEDSGSLEANNVLPKIKKHGLKHEQHLRSSILKRADGQVKDRVKYKPSESSCLKANDNNKQQRGFSLDSLKPAPPPQVILELSLPDNELMGTFTEDTCNRQRGFPQVLLYKPTVKLPASSPPVKAVHRKEVVLRARDEAMFVLQMHCYARQQKGKGLNIQGSVSTITRSSVQGSPPKEPPRELCEKPTSEMKGGIGSQTQVAAGNLEKSPQREESRNTSSARECSEMFVAKLKATTASKTSAANEVAETPMLEKVLQAQPKAFVGELCEEPAVEMKVTIASQTPTETKGIQSPHVDKFSEVPDVGSISKVTVPSEVSQSTAEEDNQVEVSIFANMSNIATSDPVSLQSIDVSQKEGDQEVSPRRNVDTSAKPSEILATSTDQDSINDISALTLVTEMVSELSPEGLAQELEIDKQQVPENSSLMESTAGIKPKVPHKISSKSSCSVPEDEASTVADDEGKKGKRNIQDIVSKTHEKGEPVETLPESEESKLEYCCTFCNKVFKGSRVVAHAMFHYRKDECMFCGTAFKDDLLAMMHLSDHIEKLKRIKESIGKQCHENLVSETKDVSTPKTSAKTKAAHVPSSHRSSGRLKKHDCAKSVSLADSKSSEIRKLRSNARQVDAQFLQQKKQNTLKRLNGETRIHDVNGHIGKKQTLHRVKRNLEAKQPHTTQKTPHGKTKNGYDQYELPENHDIDVDTSTSPAPKDFGCSRESKTKETESLQLPKKSSKQNGKEKNMEPQEKVCCPVDGCSWFTDLSKNRVALLYHALEDHYGEVKPLELALQVGNGKCSICMRVLWSFEHFLHHVERHRISPRHPCPHQGCTARFKTGMEMRRHARKHSPLQAVCCLPGCPKLFICLWALNLHEREHYASKDTKPEKNTNMQTGDKQNNSQSEKKSNDATATTAVNEAVSVKVGPTLRQQATHSLSSGKHDKAASVPTARTSQLKQELKEKKDNKDLNILKNLSNKDASAQPTVPYLRVRQTLRKEAKTSLMAAKGHRVFSSSLLKQSSRLRHKFRRKLVKVNAKSCKRRGQPPKSNQAVHDENNTHTETVQEDQKSPQLTSNLKSAEISTNEKRKHVSEAEDSVDESNLNGPVDKQIDDVQHKDGLHTTTTATILNKTMSKVHGVNKHSTTPTVSSDASKSKKRKAMNIKTNLKKIKKNGSPKEPVSVLQKSTTTKSVVETKAPEATVKISDVGGEAQVENTESTPGNSDSLAPVFADSTDKNMAPPTSSSHDTHNLSAEVNSDKSQATGTEGKKVKNTQTAGSGKAEQKEGNRRTGDEKWASAKKRKTKSEAQVEAKTILVNVETSHLTGDTMSVNEKTPTATARPETTERKKKKDAIKKRLDSKDANQRRKKINREGGAKPVKTTCPEEASERGTLPTCGSPGDSLAMNGQTANEDSKSPGCVDMLAKYSKRPYMRPPPTAYLDEKYITMPKRRKEISFFPWSQSGSPPEPASAAPALQRQRCANCFATFNSAEELQSHRRLQNCSTLFGFDSDDEGNG